MCIRDKCYSDPAVCCVQLPSVYIKPKVVIDYNKGKSSVDLSDKMPSYSSLHRKTVKWYRKLVVELRQYPHSVQRKYWKKHWHNKFEEKRAFSLLNVCYIHYIPYIEFKSL